MKYKISKIQTLKRKNLISDSHIFIFLKCVFHFLFLVFNLDVNMPNRRNHFKVDYENGY